MQINRRNTRSPLPQGLILTLLFWGSLLTPPLVDACARDDRPGEWTVLFDGQSTEH